MQKSRDRPKNLQQRFADRVLYPNHRAGLPLEGTEETLAALTAKDARDFHSQVFVPNNLTFFARGSFDADDLLARVTEAFGSWAPGPVPPQPLPHPSPAPETQRVLLVDRPGLMKTSLVLLAHDGISRRSPDRAAARLLNEAIIQRTLLTVHGENRVNRGGGSYRLSAVTHWSKVRRVIDLLLGELEQLRTETIPGPEFEKLRTQFLTRFSKSLARPRAAFFRLLSFDLYEMPESSIEEYRSWIRETTPEALRQQAQRLLHPDRAAIIVVGPAERLLPLLEGLGPIEVVPFAPASDAPAGPSVRTDSLPPE
jgi:predicted Zn-dependent peptidase